MASFGELIYLLDDGLKIPAKLMETIGVSDGSVCWGLWVDRVDKAGSEKKDESEGLHFVISPIPPKDWCRAFSLQLVLNERIGALADACKIIRDANIDIAVIDAAVSGYTHSIANAICLANFTTSQDSANIPQSPQDRFKKFGHQIIMQMRRLTRDLRFEDNIRIAANRSNLPPFLHSSTVKNAYSPLNLSYEAEIQEIAKEAFDFPLQESYSIANETLSDSANSRAPWLEREYFFRDSGSLGQDEFNTAFRDRFFRFVWRHQRFHPVTTRALSRLAKCYVWAREPVSAVKLRYHAAKNMLEFAGGTSRQHFKNHLRDRSLPMRALASINRQDRFIRVKFFDKASLKCRELYQIDVKYSISHKEGTRSSLGMLYELTSRFEDNNLEICYVRSLLKELSSETERGVIRFVVPACPSGPPQKYFDDLIRAKRDDTIRAAKDKLLQKQQEKLSSATNNRSTEESVGPPSSESASEPQGSDQGARPNSENSEKGKIEPISFIQEIRVSLAASRRVFISMPTDAVRRKEICKIIGEACDAQGFIPEYVTNTQGPITQNVRDRVRECDAFMQIVVLRRSEVMNSINDPNFHPNFAWLHFEWGLGVAQELHSRRFVDSTIPKRLLDSNIIPTNRDDYHSYFSTASNLSGLRREIIAFLESCGSTPFVRSFRGEER